MSDEELRLKVQQLAGLSFDSFAQQYSAALHLAGSTDRMAVFRQFRDKIDEYEARGWEIRKACELLARGVSYLFIRFLRQFFV